MTHLKHLSAAVLAFGLLIAVAGIAEEIQIPVQSALVDADRDTAGTEPSSLEGLLPEEPLQSPAETPGQDLETPIDPRELSHSTFEACEIEERSLCPPGCTCVKINGQVTCFCF